MFLQGQRTQGNLMIFRECDLGTGDKSEAVESPDQRLCASGIVTDALLQSWYPSVVPQ